MYIIYTPEVREVEVSEAEEEEASRAPMTTPPPPTARMRVHSSMLPPPMPARAHSACRSTCRYHAPYTHTREHSSTRRYSLPPSALPMQRERERETLRIPAHRSFIRSGVERGRGREKEERERGEAPSFLSQHRQPVDTKHRQPVDTKPVDP